MKRLIRWLYWNYGFKGDAWQSRLVVYFCPVGLEGVGDVLIAQLNSQTVQFEKVAHVHMPKLDVDAQVLEQNGAKKVKKR